MYYLQSRYYDPNIGRFINADAFATTGQGLLGNNMFTYCLNNPITFADATGTCCYIAPISYWYDCGDWRCPTSSAQNPFERIVDDIVSFCTNEDEQAVLDAEHFAFYKGVPVIKLPIGTDAFSLGIIFLGDEAGKRGDRIETVQHEYGHAVHYRMVGGFSYFANAFIPSVAGYWLGGENYDANYYSYVYEYTADALGGVNRSNYSYAATTEDWWGVYLFYTFLYP